MDFPVDPELEYLMNFMAKSFRAKWPKPNYLKRVISKVPYVVISVSQGGLFGFTYQNEESPTDMTELYRKQLWSSQGIRDYPAAKAELLRLFNRFFPKLMEQYNAQRAE